MEFSLKDLLYITSIIVSAIISFLGTRYKIKEYVRDKNEELKNKTHDLELKLSELKSKDDLQQQVIEQIGDQMNNLVPKLIEAIKERKKVKK